MNNTENNLTTINNIKVESKSIQDPKNIKDIGSLIENSYEKGLVQFNDADEYLKEAGSTLIDIVGDLIKPVKVVKTIFDIGKKVDEGRRQRAKDAILYEIFKKMGNNDRIIELLSSLLVNEQLRNVVEVSLDVGVNEELRSAINENIAEAISIYLLDYKAIDIELSSLSMTIIKEIPLQSLMILKDLGNLPDFTGNDVVDIMTGSVRTNFYNWESLFANQYYEYKKQSGGIKADKSAIVYCVMKLSNSGVIEIEDKTKTFRVTCSSTGNEIKKILGMA